MKKLIEKVLSALFPNNEIQYINEVPHTDETKKWLAEKHPEVKIHGRSIKYPIF